LICNDILKTPKKSTVKSTVISFCVPQKYRLLKLQGVGVLSFEDTPQQSDSPTVKQSDSRHFVTVTKPQRLDTTTTKLGRRSNAQIFAG